MLNRILGSVLIGMGSALIVFPIMRGDGLPFVILTTLAGMLPLLGGAYLMLISGGGKEQ